MKVFIPTYKRYQTIKSHRLFSDENLWDLKILLHTEDEKTKYLEKMPELENKIIVSGVETGDCGLIRQRNFYNKLVEKDEWYVSADDDIEQLLGVKPEYFAIPEMPAELCTKENYSYPLTTEDIFIAFNEAAERADEMGARLVGFSPTGNHFFRTTKFRTNAFCVGNLWLAKGEDWEFEMNPVYSVKEDYKRTAQHLLMYGATLRNDYIYADTKMFADGGLGGFNARYGKVVGCCELLMEEYPHLFRNNANRKHPEMELVLALRTPDQIRKWRLFMITKKLAPKEMAIDILGEEKGKQFLQKYCGDIVKMA